jgi:hypothetical protein
MRAVEGGFRTTLPRGELSEDEHVEILKERYRGKI